MQMELAAQLNAGTLRNGAFEMLKHSSWMNSRYMEPAMYLIETKGR